MIISEESTDIRVLKICFLQVTAEGNFRIHIPIVLEYPNLVGRKEWHKTNTNVKKKKSWYHYPSSSQPPLKQKEYSGFSQFKHKSSTSSRPLFESFFFWI